MIILVNPDIHGRTFWKKNCENIEQYDKVIFLGDYLDPYNFEHITVQECIDNLKEILKLKQNNPEKVILLLGNHDLPYFSDKYYKLSVWHCRHSKKYHNEIHKLFNDNKKLFQIAYNIDNILFTHAGVESKWLTEIVKCKETNISKITETLNTLIQDENIHKLYCITEYRGGRDKYGSCVWTDVHDMAWDAEDETTPIFNMKQIFGHTLQAYYNQKGEIEYGQYIEFNNCKMIDNAKPYILNTKKFTLLNI